MQHFASALLDVLGLDVDVDTLWYGGREVRLGAFPMGVDAQAFSSLAAGEDAAAEVAMLRRTDGPPEHLLLGIDRLDYTKGIRARLFGLERLLEREPSLRGRVRLIQVAVPSRTKIEAYDDFRRRVEELVGRINGAYATVASAPVHYMFRSLSQRQVVALYRATDTMLVTPLRDGMNLVAKEFVASRNDEDGVLVLSEFAGAASELGDAVIVNPHDVDAIATAIKTAIAMPKEERQTRMRALRRRVATYDVHYWARSFIDRLEETRARATLDVQVPSSRERITALLADLRRAEQLLLLLDYDGTLVPFATTPDAAQPDTEVRELLSDLASRRGALVHVLTGRSRETLERWLGDLPIGLHAEYGYWSRLRGGSWTATVDIATDWKEKARPYFDQVTSKTPGSIVEEKATAIAWHYRKANAAFGALQAKELKVHLAHMLRNAPVEFVQGDKVVEARVHGVHKGVVLASLLRQIRGPFVTAALGHDRSNEDLFACLPEPNACIHVGAGRSRALFRLAGPTEARAFLRSLLPTKE
jgi:trehalose 6-phosphate synthase/phosphatase